jgi:hypothetical protein
MSARALRRIVAHEPVHALVHLQQQEVVERRPVVAQPVEGVERDLRDPAPSATARSDASPRTCACAGASSWTNQADCSSSSSSVSDLTGARGWRVILSSRGAAPQERENP